MIDFARSREPVEVFEAALGNPEPLAQRIESEVEIGSFEREALAALIRGELVVPKRKRGVKMLPGALPTRADRMRQDRENAVSHYRELMARVEEKAGTRDGYAEKVLQYVAEQNGVAAETLRNDLNRAKPANDGSNRQAVTPVVKSFVTWLHRTGKLPGYEPHVSLAAWVAVKEWRRMLRERD